MERDGVSGLRAANAVLKKRDLPEVEILRLPKESLTLRAARALCRVLRRAFWKNYPASNTKMSAKSPKPNNFARCPLAREDESEERVLSENFK